MQQLEYGIKSIRQTKACDCSKTACGGNSFIVAVAIAGGGIKLADNRLTKSIILKLQFKKNAQTISSVHLYMKMYTNIYKNIEIKNTSYDHNILYFTVIQHDYYEHLPSSTPSTYTEKYEATKEFAEKLEHMKWKFSACDEIIVIVLSYGDRMVRVETIFLRQVFSTSP